MQKPCRYAAEPKAGSSIAIIFICFYLSNVNGATQPRCDFNSCKYYTMLAEQPSHLFEQAGVEFFQQCDCTIYGLTLPDKLNVTNTRGVCGRSGITGSASDYLSALNGRVVGGTDAEECKYPWTVIVLSGGFRCGGTIIDDRHIVTASHCLQSGNYLIPAGNIRVGVGSSAATKLVYYDVETVIRHPNYAPATFDYDIAVLRLTLTLPQDNSCIKPICLPSTSLDISPGVQCVVAGWGATTETAIQGATDLQEAVIPIITQSSCAAAYGDRMITDRKLCAGYTTGGIDACKGDSGGPFFCADGDSWVLAGVVSFGNGCARPDYPGVYANVVNLKTWIDAVTM